MKKVFIYTLIMAIFNYNIGVIYADSSEYGRVSAYYTTIYKTPSLTNDISNTICFADTTYFVKILSSNTDSYHIEYNGITGYVKKSNITLVSGTPLMPYPNDITILTGSICHLRSSPTVESSNIIATIPSNTTTLRYIGKAVGDEAMDFGGNTWYYVSYEDKMGYIYNKYIESISSIFANTESLDTIDESTPINTLTDTETYIYIIVLSIPFVVILCILYFPPKRRDKV